MDRQFVEAGSHSLDIIDRYTLMPLLLLQKIPEEGIQRQIKKRWKGGAAVDRQVHFL